MILKMQKIISLCKGAKVESAHITYRKIY